MSWPLTFNLVFNDLKNRNDFSIVWGRIDQVGDFEQDSISNPVSTTKVYTKQEFSSCLNMKDVNLLHGQYLALTWCKGQSELRVYRDHIGTHPAYFHISDNQLTIASYLKEICKDKKLTTNHHILKSIAEHQFTLLDQTQFNEIQKIPAGNYLDIRLHKTEIKHRLHLYSDLIFRTKNQVDRYKSLNLRTLLRNHVGDKTGLLLSGGVDSSILYNACSDLKNFYTFSMNFESSPAKEETQVLLNAKLNPRHTALVYEQLEHLPFLPPKEPVNAFSFYVPNLYLFKPLIESAKKQQCTEIWTGLGGDDIFNIAGSTLETYSLARIRKFLMPALRKGELATFELKDIAKSLIKKIFFPSKAKTHLEVLQQRFFVSGGYAFGMEMEQEFAQNLGVRISYPFLDSRLIQYSACLTEDELCGDYQVTKPSLRKLAEDILPSSMKNHVSEQDYINIINEHLIYMKKHFGCDNIYDFFKISVTNYCSDNLSIDSSDDTILEKPKPLQPGSPDTQI